MASNFDVDLVRRRLEGRFGTPLESAHEEMDGGSFYVLRPAQLEKGNGFGIVLSRTHRQVEASFKADNFAGVLLRRMSEADENGKAVFRKIFEQATSAGTQVYSAVNGSPLVFNSDGVEQVWRSVEFDAIKRLPSAQTAEVVIEGLLEVSYTCLSLALSLLTVEEFGDTVGKNTEGLPEGALVRVEVNKYERSPVNRANCIAHFGPICQVCGFNFSRFYGAVGEGYIEVHHRTPVSSLGSNYIVNPLTDLVPVCSNCHSILHRSNPPMNIEFLREIVKAMLK